MTLEKIFMVFDRVSNNPYLYRFAPTAGALIRDIGKQLYQLNPNFEKDLELFEIANLSDFNVDSLESPLTPVFVRHSWDEYSFPESTIEKSSPDSDLING